MTTTTTAPTLVERIMDYESGALSDADTVDLFADLVTSGMAWQLQGHYGRGAQALIDARLIIVDPETGVATSNYDHEED